MASLISRLRPITLLYSKICLGVVILLEAIDLGFDWRDILYSDHGIIEFFTLSIALAAFCFGLRTMLTQQRSAWWPYSPIFALNIFLLLEETSFGQDIFGFPSFKFGGVYFDAFHDIFSLAYKHLGTYILVLLVIGLVVLYKNYDRLIAPILKNYPPYRFVFIGSVLIGISILFDLNMIYHPPTEEYLEMLGILAVFFAHLDVARAISLPIATAAPSIGTSGSDDV